MTRRYPSYRASGVASIGEIPSHWRIAELGRIGSFFKGGGGTKEDETDEGRPCIRYGDLYTRHDFHIRESRSRISPERAAVYTKLHHGDLLLAGSGETLDEIGKSAANLLREPAFCGGDVVILRPEVDVDATYLGYAADCAPSRHQKSCMGRGVTVMHIYGSELKRLVLPVPPLQEQKQIAAHLDREMALIDELISKQESLIGRLDEYRTALITQAVTTGLPKEAAKAAGLNPGPKLKDSGVEWLGEVPAHWEIARLKWSTTGCIGGVWGDEPDGVDDLLCVRVADFDRHAARVSLRNPTLRSVSISHREGRMLGVGDLLLEKSGGGVKQLVGCVVLYDHDVPAVCSNFVGRVALAENAHPAYWTYVHRALYAGKLNYPAIKQTTGIQNLDTDAYFDTPVAFPPYPEQIAIAEYLDTAADHIDALRAKARLSIERLSEYRSAVISAAVTGKIDVRDEALVGGEGGA